MSNFLSKIKVKSALQAKRNKFDLSMSHISTGDFYQNVPIYCKEMIPNETLKVDVASMTRCAPLVNPMFGNVKMLYRAFFVPYRVIYPAWNDFIEETSHVFPSTGRSIPQFVPRVQLDHIYKLFTSNTAFAYVTDGVGDFSYHSGTTTSSDVVSLILTDKGRLVYKILTSLGYKLNWATYNLTNGDKSEYISAMPILAFAKVWTDWFANPQYDVATSLDTYFTDVNNRTLVVSDLATIFNNVVLLTYDLDYFTAAWDNPASPNTGLVRNQTIHDVSLMQGVGPSSLPNQYGTSVTLEDRVNNPSGGAISTPVLRAEPTGSTVPSTVNEISQYILNALHSVTDYITRFRMVGSRALDRYMAEYGIQLSSEKLKRSVYLGKSESNFRIGDVTQTTPDSVNGSSTQFGVGTYTGKMLGEGNGKFEYTTDEYGLFIITCFILPRNNYVYGRPRSLFHLSNLDFFKGDYDALGTQGIRQDELVTFPDQVATQTQGYNANGIFGFTPRYAEYKIALDNLSGDFLLGSRNTLLDGWYLARKFDVNSPNQLRHTATFCYADGSQYNSIWQDGDSSFDHFFTVHYFNVESFAPMKTLFDLYDYSNDDGKNILTTLNGTNVMS